MLAIVGLSLVACNSDDSFLEDAKVIGFDVYNGSTSTHYTTLPKKDVHIEPAVKSGYYLTGYFDSETGGTMYFDANGDSTSVWQKDYPATFYAQWDDIKNMKTIEWDWAYENQYYLGRPKTLSFAVSKQPYMNAIQGNYDKTLEIKLQLRIATQECPLVGIPADDETQGYDIEFRDKASDNGYETFATKTVRTVGSKWNDFTIIITCPAKIFKGDLTMSVYVRRYNHSDSDNYYPESYMKEIRMEARFV